MIFHNKMEIKEVEKLKYTFYFILPIKISITILQILLKKGYINITTGILRYSDHPKNLGHYNYCVNLDLLLVVFKGNLCHYYPALSVFSENMGHPQLIKIVIVKNCPKLQRIYIKDIFQNLINQ